MGDADDDVQFQTETVSFWSSCQEMSGINTLATNGTDFTGTIQKTPIAEFNLLTIIL
jgi:hypothetical protein